jgi:hypothetical protein
MTVAQALGSNFYIDSADPDSDSARLPIGSPTAAIRCPSDDSRRKSC